MKLVLCTPSSIPFRDILIQTLHLPNKLQYHFLPDFSDIFPTQIISFLSIDSHNSLTNSQINNGDFGVRIANHKKNYEQHVIGEQFRNKSYQNSLHIIIVKSPARILSKQKGITSFFEETASPAITLSITR